MLRHFHQKTFFSEGCEGILSKLNPNLYSQMCFHEVSAHGNAREEMWDNENICCYVPTWSHLLIT